MILIYSPQITNRVKYTFQLYFAETYGVSFELTSKKEQFKNFEGPKFSYAYHPIEDEIFFKSADLLFKSEISMSWEDVGATRPA